MPWSEDRYPNAMKHLDAQTREKAIEIANALLREGRDEGFAIRVGIAKAEEWVRSHRLSGGRPSGDWD
jgi:uncharacterized protein YdaT